MAPSPKTVRNQIIMLQPIIRSCSVETIRKGQNLIGELMHFKHRNQVLVRSHPFDRFEAAWVLPQDERRQGVILYLHGGGYTYGDLEYAKGFGSTLAVQCGVRVFCPAYRLAPEHPYPAALEDALTAYEYLLEKGYDARHITICGESAGGGLCYALCLKLKEKALPLPASIVTVSPWTDLTASGASYESNREREISLSKNLIDFFADNYTKNRKDPMASPLFGNLEGLPPSLIFVGGDEILLSDSEEIHKRLLSSGCKSHLVVTPERWHGYLLYGLEEDRKDFLTLNRFLNRTLSEEKKLRWMPLDNAAKIYPAARNQNWSNVFRVSATLTETVDTTVLQSALDVTVRRFPSIAARLRKGVFWYYLQQLDAPPKIRREISYPLPRMSRREVRKCALRVVVYNRRIALELFHSLTDGTGALVFLKSLLAEYLQQKYGIRISATAGVVGRLEEPSREELEDSFQKYSGRVSASRKENDSWHLRGTPEPDGFLHITCFRVSVEEALAKAREYGFSLTVFLAAALMKALQDMQISRQPDARWRKPIRVQLPVNLRNIFPSRSLRNFALYVTPEIDPRLGEFSFPEICNAIYHRMGLEITPKHMSTRIAANVGSERLMIVKLMPLFLKNIVMKAVFHAVGERKSTLSLSNLGRITVPEEMQPYIERFDFILGVQATAPHNCGVISYGDTLYINFIRNVRESELEARFYRVLQELGLSVQVESNGDQP
ncbi:MAG: steryl acetyl hydrolase [Ruminococcaceae bacterium]|nr:steryl acetyl hydrolase [Oscillospiraceae bacterium]